VGNFEVLAKACELHAGIILLEERHLLRDDQLELLRIAITALAGESDLINRVLRINRDRTLIFEETLTRGG